MNNLIDKVERVPNNSATIKNKMGSLEGKFEPMAEKRIWSTQKMSDDHYARIFTTKPKFAPQCI